MKLHDVNVFAGCYIYSTSHRFCFPFTFAPFTTVEPLDHNFSKAVSIMWNRKDRSQLRALHDDLMTSLIGHRLQRLHDMSVIAFAFKGSYKGERGSIAAVKWLADAEQVAKAQHFWASVRDELTKGGNQPLAESLVLEA